MDIFVITSKTDKEIYVDKYICKKMCDECHIRFQCYSHEWKQIEGRDVTVIFDRDELRTRKGLEYCCRLHCHYPFTEYGLLFSLSSILPV